MSPAGMPDPVTARRRLPLAIVLLVVGVAAFIVGGILAWGAHALLGFAIGCAGTVAIVIGAILFRNAMVARFVLAQEGEA